MKSNSWIQIISWHFSHVVLNNVLALIISTTVSTVTLAVASSSFLVVLTGWHETADGYRHGKSAGVENSQTKHSLCRYHSNLSGNWSAVDSTVDCFSWKSASICFAFVLIGKAKMILLHKWHCCRKEGGYLYHSRQGQCAVLLGNYFNAQCSVLCMFTLQSCTNAAGNG